MIIIGVDPGTIKTGYGVIHKSGSRITKISSGIIKMDASAPLDERLVVLYESLSKIIIANNPEQAAVEDLFFAKNANSALKLGHARGVILLCLKQSGIKIETYPPTMVKRAIVGKGRAAKNQIQMVVQSIIGSSTALLEDEADAIALAICHSNAVNLKSRILK
jgi:crossover junction endodeoxyribonuclease RuvC